MNLYSITNRTSGLHLGDYLGMDVADAIDAMACDAGYDSQAHAAAALGTTVAALNADLIVAEHDYAADLVRLADAMVDDDRSSGECSDDVLDDADAGSSDHWDARGVYDVAEEMGLSAATVDAIGWDNIRDAYAAAWRAAVEFEMSSRDEVK
jgi:hypothetical protein